MLKKVDQVQSQLKKSLQVKNAVVDLVLKTAGCRRLVLEELLVVAEAAPRWQHGDLYHHFLYQLSVSLVEVLLFEVGQAFIVKHYVASTLFEHVPLGLLINDFLLHLPKVFQSGQSIVKQTVEESLVCIRRLNLMLINLSLDEHAQIAAFLAPREQPGALLTCQDSVEALRVCS